MGGSNSGGRNSRPPSEHRRLGTYRPHRHDGFDTPEPPNGRPKPPRRLSPAEQAEWDLMVQRLEDSKTLTECDDAALYQYCQLHVETQSLVADRDAVLKMSASLKRQAMRLEGKDLVDAIAQISKLYTLAQKYTQQLRQGHMALRQYLVEFGMTPGSRTRVKVIKPPKQTSRLLAFRGGKADESREETPAFAGREGESSDD